MIADLTGDSTAAAFSRSHRGDFKKRRYDIKAAAARKQRRHGRNGLFDALNRHTERYFASTPLPTVSVPPSACAHPREQPNSSRRRGKIPIVIIPCICQPFATIAYLSLTISRHARTNGGLFPVLKPHASRFGSGVSLSLKPCRDFSTFRANGGPKLRFFFSFFLFPFPWGGRNALSCVEPLAVYEYRPIALLTLFFALSSRSSSRRYILAAPDSPLNGSAIVAPHHYGEIVSC